MASGKGLALKFLQWFIRGVQFGCSALILAIFSYFLATLSNHNLNISNHVRAVEGISGLATLYTIIGLVLLCCIAGYPLTSFIAILLDACFAASFIYVAWVNRHGAGSCNGYVDTPYGEGNSDSDVNGSDGFTNLPNFRQACRMQTACFSVALVAIFFFLFSIGVEIFLARHRKKEKRFGPSPANNYTSGSGKKAGGAGLFSSWRRNKDNTVPLDNQLPEHTTPNQVRTSYNTEATAVGHQDTPYSPKYSPDTAAAAPAHDAGGYSYPTGGGYGGNGYTNVNEPYGDAAAYQTTGTTGAPAGGHYQANPYRYDDGVYDRA